jgi:CxxC motif-containing protein (DUF1111 family)
MFLYVASATGEVDDMARDDFARAYSLTTLSTILLSATLLSSATLAQTAAPSATQSAAAAAPAATGTASTAATASRSRGPVDPGVRAGDPGAGDGLTGLTDAEQKYFDVAKEVFQEVDGVAEGLGPRFNLDSCAGCHSQPAIGGTAPAINPQVKVGKAANNVIPSFITENGPVREARFVRNRDGSPDGGVHALFVITGRDDAGTCKITQPNFAAELARNNVVFRIPTPTFGLGLVENVSDATLEAALAANAGQKRALGISGRFNRSGNDGTITKFGWKAQNKSLLMFSGEAYNVEMGITNEMFMNERENDPSCQANAIPEDTTPMEAEDTASPAANYQNDITLFAAFMRLSAAPKPAGATPAPAAQAAASSTVVASADSVLPVAAGTNSTSTAAAAATPSATATVDRGRQVFGNVGCAACHVPSQTTAKSSTAALSNVTFAPFSDFALHDMGQGLADGVSQGGANGREFRTAPLWGVGQRIFFLHDGRTKDLNEAIQQHASRGSEANTVVGNYNMLSVDDRQAILNFLRSL